MENEYALHHHLLSSGACVDMVWTPWLSVGPMDYSFIFRLAQRELVLNLTSAINWINNHPRWLTLLQQEFKIGSPCASTVIQGYGTTDPVSWRSMRGLFLIYAACMGLSLLTAIVNRWLGLRLHIPSEADLLREVLEKFNTVEVDNVRTVVQFGQQPPRVLKDGTPVEVEARELRTGTHSTASNIC